MKLSDADFFHQATKIICGSLDIHVVLKRCLVFFQKFMPVDSITIKVYDPGTRSVINIATEEGAGLRSIETPIPVSEEVAQLIEEDDGPRVDLVNRMDKDFLTRFLWKAMGREKMSSLALKLEIEDERLGAVIFLAKGIDRYTREQARMLDLLHDPFAIALANTLKHQEVLRLKDQLADDNKYLHSQLRRISGDEIIGSESGLKYVMDMVRQIAPQNSQALLLGETGTGKEIIANAIHYASPRADRPLIKVNCGAIPDNLIDSELFGHEKGAFTGAVTQKKGRFERAHKGTLFLDEIGELPPQVQVRLLRVLENKQIERVGGTRTIPVDIRIIAATHRDLPAMVREGKFREDLWFRLNVFPITIPPLRQRKQDIPGLVQYFMEKKAREMNFYEPPVLAPGTLEQLNSYTWPGNIRELENLVERTLIQSLAKPSGTPLKFTPPAPIPNNKDIKTCADIPEGSLILDNIVRHHIRTVLKLSGGKVQGEGGAAALLDVHPNTLRYKMKKLGIPYGRKARLCNGEFRFDPLILNRL
ncbi:sigma 54-interacting transcriptional regulator [uncultured Desulfobacter sp.]|uniref:sigma-54 interaction domain-containing protein n=1 Tax=uncultured Desulfobacter sp. TaxID=240139 RepID=UPI0029C8FD6B|nr:sigma 54-interacting transcriptional regulator [uncultured Desulfobacter sp.]